MSFLNKITGTPICSRLIALSFRNLSISSKATTTNNSIVFGSSQHEGLNPLIARPNISIIKDVGIGGPLWRKKEYIDLPLTNKIIESPTSYNKIIEDITNIEKTISLPTIDQTGNTIKQCKNNMIMVRRRKMKKHKLRKLRKRMKFVYAKIRQRREWRKEKRFTTELIAQCNEAESFSAEKYVAEKIRLATETPIPRFWQHKRLPQFIIKQKIEQEEKKKIYKKFKMWEESEKQESTN